MSTLFFRTALIALTFIAGAASAGVRLGEPAPDFEGAGMDQPRLPLRTQALWLG